MHIPPLTDPRWELIISGKKQVQLDFLAAKMMLVRLQMSVLRGETKVLDAVAQFRDLLITNQGLPKVQADIQRLAQ